MEGKKMSPQQQITQEELEIRMNAINEALAAMQAQGADNASTKLDASQLVDPQDALNCEGCQ
jgi:hypothetical protein